MRKLTINLWSNNGTSAPGALQVVSGQIFDLADLTQEVDGNNGLTKVTPGTLTAKVGDPDGSIWTFIQNQLALPLDANGNAQGLLPPWIELYAGSTRLFVGTGDLPSFTQIFAADDYSIECKAFDWSMPLASTYLGAPTAVHWQPNYLYAVGNQVLNGTSVYQCLVAGKSGSGGGPNGIATGIFWAAATAYYVGAEVIANGNCYLCTISGTSASSGGPSGTGTAITDGGVTWEYTSAAIVDGTVTWAWVPPTWQRPIPTIAVNPQAVSAVGESQSYPLLMAGYNLSTIFFPDPQGGFAPGQTLSMTIPALHYIPRAGVGCPTIGSGLGEAGLGDTATDIDGELCTVEQVGTGHEGSAILGWVVTTPWSTPIGCPSMTLPSAQWPAGFIIATSTGSSMWQVSTDGSTWTPITVVPVSGVKPLIVATTDNFMYDIDTGLENAGIPYLYVTVTPNPWPAVSGMAWNPYRGHFFSTFTLANPTSQEIHYWLTTTPTVSNPPTPVYWLDLNSVAGIVAGDTLQVIDANFTWSGVVTGVDPILCRVTLTEPITTAIPQGTHIYWDTDSQLDLVMEDPRNILAQAVLPYSVDTTSQFFQPLTPDPMFGFLPLRPQNSATLWPIGDMEPTLSNIKLSTGAVWINPANGQPLTTYSWTGDPDNGWTGPVSVTTSPAPMSDWTRQLVSAPSSLMPYEVVSFNPWQRVRNRPYSDVSYYRENNGIIQVVISGVTYNINGDYVTTTNNATTNYANVYSYEQNGTVYTTTDADFTPWSTAWAPWAGPSYAYDYTASTPCRILFSGGTLTVQPWNGVLPWGTGNSYTWPGTRYIQDIVPMIGMPGYYLAITVDSSTAITHPQLELWEPTAGGAAATIAMPQQFVGGQLATTPYGVYIVAGACIGALTYSGGTLAVQTLYLTDQINWLWANTLVARTPTEIAILGRLDDQSTGATITSTFLFRLSLPFSAILDASTILGEKVIDGVPPTVYAMRDPTKPGRIVGHMGGSLWQIDATRPWCIARFRPSGMTAMELVEHIAQAFCALAIPNVATGVMQMVSRLNNAYPTGLTVKQVSIKNIDNWKEFATIIRCSASNDPDVYWDAPGLQGGVKLEIDQHPLCYSLSDCMGLAESWAEWFGVPRIQTEQEWFYQDSNSAPPWEGVQMFSPVIVNGGAPMRLMSLSQNLVKGSANVKLLQSSAYTLPWVDYSDSGHQWLYNLKVDLTSYPTTYTSMVQRRDLLDQVNHTFADYATIPTSILDLVGLNVQSAQQPKDMFGLQVTNAGEIYLIACPGMCGSFNTTNNRNSVTSAQLYQLTSVDGSGNGTWTLVTSDTLPYSAGPMMVGGGGAWGGSDTPIQYTYGDFPISYVTNTTLVGGDEETVNVTQVTFEFMSPFFLNAKGAATNYKPRCTMYATCVNNGASYDDVLLQTYSGTINDTIGNAATILPTYDGYMYSGNEYGIITGTLINLKSISFFSPYTYGMGGGTFGVVQFPLDAFSSVTCDSDLGTPTSIQASYLDSTGKINPMMVPTSNGNDPLVGILGGNQVGYYRKTDPASHTALPLFTYSNMYVCAADDLVHQYSIYSLIEPSTGEIIHLEGVESPIPALYRGSVKILELNS